MNSSKRVRRTVSVKNDNDKSSPTSSPTSSPSSKAVPKKGTRSRSEKQDNETESIEGGKSKKNQVNQIQEIINKKLNEMIDMKQFEHITEIKLVPNLKGAVCPSCKSVNMTYAETVQLRSGDEAADRICTCLVCNHHWKISGST